MSKSQKKLIILIEIVLVIIMIILLSIVYINRNKNYNKNNINNLDNTVGENEGTEIIDNNIMDYGTGADDEYIKYSGKDQNSDMKKIRYIDNRSEYFTINSLYNRYINLIGNKDKTSLNNILSQQYKEQYNVTDNNIFDKLVVPSLTNSSQYYKPIITEMLTAQIENNVSIYIVKGKCRIVNMENTILDINVMFEIDASNNLYCVYPYQYMKDKGYDNLKVDQAINCAVEKIEKNNNNEFKYVTKNDLEIATEYFNNYKELLQYYPDDAYNKLNSEYSKKRFANKENFNLYLKDNKSTIALMSINKYKVNSYKDYTDYICSDKYNNMYIFRQQGGIMRYSAFLDNYTIMLDEDVEYYNKLDKFDKGKYNLSKFIKQVNTKDYTAIYNSLDETFRINNFKTQDSLKKYIQNNLYNFNSIEIENSDNETYEYYVFECKVTDLRNSSKTKNMTVILNQGEETNYTISFSFE